jgi:homospermidine synthase
MLNYRNKLVILGFGSIGSGLLPLLLLHFRLDQILVIGGDNRNISIAEQYGLKHVIQPLDQTNYKEILSSYLNQGDFLINLSVNVSSLALVEWSRTNNVLYIDTCIEPWEGYYTDTTVLPEKRSNYFLRQEILDLRKSLRTNHESAGPTAVMAHGANPGLVNHFVKRALIHIAQKHNQQLCKTIPQSQVEWCQLAKDVGLKVIHIAERDTQQPQRSKTPGEFVNTWSIDGFVSEGLQPSELGWGSHEKHWPIDANHFTFGCGSAVWLSQPGCITKVRSWTPNEGAYHGWIITHNESISISDYLSAIDGYRPTVHYAYHPCDDAVLSMHELAGKNFVQQSKQRLIVDEVISGVDELGVLLMGDFGAYWYGSVLSIETTRRLAPHNNATSLQVVAPVLAAILWAIENPNQGIVEADELPFDKILSITDPFMGKLVGKWTDWTPLQDRGRLFKEDLDYTDPWQFLNFRIK